MAVPFGVLLSAELQELFYCEASFGDDAPKRTWANALVVRDYDARMGHVASKYHVTTGLAAEYKASSFQHRANVPI